MRIIHCAWAAALLSALAAGSCAKDTAGNGGTGTTESYNDKIDSYLAERYLWNSEYGQMTRDLTIEYAADNDNFLTRTLLGMTSNTLDKKRYTNGTGQNYYKLYSYITRKARSRAASITASARRRNTGSDSPGWGWSGSPTRGRPGFT